MTRTKIMEVTQEYGKLASILPEEIEDSNIIDELISIRDKIMKSIAADGEDLKTLLLQKDKQVDYQKLENVDNLIEKGFYKKVKVLRMSLNFIILIGQWPAKQLIYCQRPQLKLLLN